MPQALPADVNGKTTGKQLFNGNIAAMAVNIPQLGNGIVYGYSYDQLNRIVRMDAFNRLSNADNSFTPVRTNNYHEAISYDPNGNIKTYLRNGDSRSLNMDNLSYSYTPNTNQLSQVTDAVTTPTPADYNDLKTQGPNNYTYDKIGNLISDISEGISNIDWAVYGKIRSITKTNGTVIKYTYDASGNRISKIVTTATTGDSTYYVRDASGNVMSVYNKKGTLDLTQTEIHLYGSSRLGVYNVNVDVQNCSSITGSNIIFTRGNKFFELVNHLGNVMAVISDKRLPVSLDGIFTAYYKADMVTANDYYPFGMQMPGRIYSEVASGYRYGFNGKEKDNEVKGEGNEQDYGMRIYDTRLGRFLSVDPLSPHFPMLTPYQFASNNPIQNIDIDGLEGSGRNGARTSTIVAWNLDFLKGKRESYENSSWIGWPFGTLKPYIFVKNSVTSGWNQGISAVEDFPSNVNFITTKHSKAEKLEMLFNVTNKLVSWWNSKPYQKIQTYEDIAGAFLLGEGLGAANPFARGNSYIELVIKDRVPITIATDEATIRYMQKFGKKADYMPSTDNNGSIVLTKNSRIQLVEEAIHYKQVKIYGIAYSQENLNMLEFDAQLELLRIGKLEGWSKTQMKEIGNAAKIWGKRAVADIDKELNEPKK